MSNLRMYADLLPPLATEEFNALKADIKANGVLHPVFVDEEGNVLDGRHRLKIDPNAPRKVIEGLTEAEKQAFVFRSNFVRRNLTRDQKAEARRKMKDVARALREEDPKKWTQNRVAEALGVAQRTVSDWFTTNSGSANGSKPVPAISLDARVKLSKEQKADIVVQVDAGRSQAQVGADYGVSQQVVSKIVTAAEKVKKADQKAERHAEEAAKSPSRFVIVGDYRTEGHQIPDDSVDLIFTDPPYDAATVPQYSDLAAFAKRVLIPGGSLICYIGHYAIADIMALMGPHLRYWWLNAIIHTGGNKAFPGKFVHVAWKPLLWFVKDHRATNNMVRDCITSTPGDKEVHHEWAQGKTEAVYYIEHLSRKNGLIVDPYCGGGTTGIAAVELGRQFKGFEISKERARKSEGRIFDAFNR